MTTQDKKELPSLKPTQRIMELCDEMFDRRKKFGKNFPIFWREGSRKKMADHGLVYQVDKETVYFTETGLEWYFTQRPERRT